MNYTKALEDAETCIKLEPEYAKGYLRKGRALIQLGYLEESIKCLEKGLELEQTNIKMKDR